MEPSFTSGDFHGLHSLPLEHHIPGSQLGREPTNPKIQLHDRYVPLPSEPAQWQYPWGHYALRIWSSNREMIRSGLSKARQAILFFFQLLTSIFQLFTFTKPLLLSASHCSLVQLFFSCPKHTKTTKTLQIWLKINNSIKTPALVFFQQEYIFNHSTTI